MAKETVTLATLVRGKVYKHFHNGDYIEFRRNTPKVVDDDLAVELEDMTDEVNTDEKDVIEVEKFKIERDVPASRIEEDEEGQVRQRTRLVRETVPVRKKPKKVRKASTGFKGSRKKLG